MDAYDLSVCEELKCAVDEVLRKNYDLYFDREKAKKVLQEWAKAVLRDEVSAKTKGE